jgi:hypothetical protein
MAFLISPKNNYFSIMKTITKQIKSSDITYNPALDRFQGRVIFKEKLLAAEEFLKKHGMPK